MPANLCTPQIFCDRAEALFKDVPGVEIFVREEGQSSSCFCLPALVLFQLLM